MFNFFNKEIRYAVRTSGWSKLRKEHIKKQPSCMACGTKKELEVHHIVPVHLAPEFELNPNNLITLCYKCHFLIGHLKDYKSWNENVVQDSEILLKKIKNRPYSLDNAEYQSIIDTVMGS